MLKGKIAIITGGSRGIGFATVKTFLDNGATVILFGSRQETVDKALNQLKKNNPNYSVDGMAPNLQNAEEIAECIHSIKEKYGRIDILVNNAGISQNTPLLDYKPGDFEMAISINVTALFHTIQPVVSIMKDQGGGVILNTSSMVSISGQAAGVGYPTSKFAVNGMTLSLARELGKYNIRVNAVAPGITRTDMVAALPKETIETMAAKIPLQRMGEPQDIANAFLFLASDMASYVTGEILSVDGAMRS